MLTFRILVQSDQLLSSNVLIESFAVAVFPSPKIQNEREKHVQNILMLCNDNMLTYVALVWFEFRAAASSISTIF